MSLNVKKLEVIVPFSLIDLNGNSSFKAYLDFVNAIEELSKKNKDLCILTDKNVVLKDKDTYDQLATLKNKNRTLSDLNLLKKEKELFSKNMYEATVSILYNMSYDTEIIKAYTELQMKLLKLKTIPTVRGHNFYDPKKMLFETALNLKKYKVNSIQMSSVKGDNGIYKTNFSYLVPYDDKDNYPKSFAILKKSIKRKLIMNYDFPIVLSGKGNFKEDPNVSFDITTKDVRDYNNRLFLSTFELDENKYSNGPISIAKKEYSDNDYGRSFSLEDELAKLYFNSVYNKCESVHMSINIENNAYVTRMRLRIKEKDLNKFTSILDYSFNNLEEMGFLTERNTSLPDEKGEIEFTVGTSESLQNKSIMTI